MTKNYFAVLLFSAATCTTLFAQEYNNDELPEELKLTRQDTTIVSSNMVGLGFNMIMDGEVDEYPEAAFNLKGTIDEVIEAGKKMLAEAEAEA